ncbi:conserved exported protein of unknown function [Tenacibaculum sp. 190130A14a]|uniref:Lipocalin-like domain-containing protein n=1 Tax=Tenacibaculum polynesiense TaxID=3137857 RepID=A0ABM9PCL5_9FLAO
MKIRILSLLLISSTILFLSCSNNDEFAEAKNISGTWNLKKIYGGFAANSNFNAGDVVWTFNTKKNTVFIENNINTAIEPTTGTYKYTIQQNGDKKALYINNIRKGDIIILSNTKLKLDFEAQADGFFTELER